LLNTPSEPIACHLKHFRQLTESYRGARRSETEAVAILEEVGNKSEAERVRMTIAELLLDEGKITEAGSAARRSVAVLEEKKARRAAAIAKLILAQALLSEGHLEEARTVAAQLVTSSSRSSDEESQLRSEIVSAQIDGIGGSLADANNSVRRLNKVMSAATAASFVEVALEARLAAGVLEVGKGDRDAGRSHLKRLETDCTKAGFAIIARRASTALRTASLQAGG
jgi:hypothetical protein